MEDKDKDKCLPINDVQDLVLEEDSGKRQEMLNSLCIKYQMKQVRILKQLQDMLGEEEYRKRFVDDGIEREKEKVKEEIGAKINAVDMKQAVEEEIEKIEEAKEKTEVQKKIEEENIEEKRNVHFEDLKFCKIKRSSKKPFEPNWPNKPYTWDEIQEHIRSEENFGVLCGYEGLIIVDADKPEFRDFIQKELPKTFTVQTGGDTGGMHFYYICPQVKKKIVLQVAKEDKHFGEVQSWGAQCVGPGSIHVKTGRKYKIIEENGRMIPELDYEKLLAAIKPFSEDIKEKEARTMEELQKLKRDQVDKYGESDINTISILSVINDAGFKKATNGEFFGGNPWHGSRTGMNFWVNPSKNLAFCFRCSAGINIAQAIALNEGIIHTCSDKLTNDQFFRVLEIAYNKYGLKKTEVEYTDGSWIKKIVNKLKISELATEFGLNKCRDCSQELKFDDRVGRFTCNCGNHGNLVDITELWIKDIKRKKEEEELKEKQKKEEEKKDG